jgi:hypothetical protein
MRKMNIRMKKPDAQAVSADKKTDNRSHRQTQKRGNGAAILAGIGKNEENGRPEERLAIKMIAQHIARKSSRAQTNYFHDNTRLQAQISYKSGAIPKKKLIYRCECCAF